METYRLIQPTSQRFWSCSLYRWMTESFREQCLRTGHLATGLPGGPTGAKARGRTQDAALKNQRRWQLSCVPCRDAGRRVGVPLVPCSSPSHSLLPPPHSCSPRTRDRDSFVLCINRVAGSQSRFLSPPGHLCSSERKDMMASSCHKLHPD